MDTKKEKFYNMTNQKKKDNLRNEITFQNMLVNPNNIFELRAIPNVLILNPNFLNKKRDQPINENIESNNDNNKIINKCPRCHEGISNNNQIMCQTCLQHIHINCLNEQEYNMSQVSNNFQCSECQVRMASLFNMNYNSLSYNQLPNGPLRMVPTPSLFESVQLPILKIKNSGNQSDYQQKDANEIDNDEPSPAYILSNGAINNNGDILINSFGQSQANDFLSNKFSLFNDINTQEIVEEEEKTKNVFTKSTLQILENTELTNEERLLYLRENYPDIYLDPLITKVLADRKNFRKNIALQNNQYLENNNLEKEKRDKFLFTLKKKLLGEQNYPQLIQNNNYMPVNTNLVTFPLEDKILFKDLEKYEVSKDILDRPIPTKISIDYKILNKLFLIWDFLLSFKESVIDDKINDLEIDEDIVSFYKKLVDKNDNFNYYKKIFVLLLLMCIKNIPICIGSPKEARLFILKSVLDNLNSTSYNIIYDSPLLILKELSDSFLYNNYIDDNNLKIIEDVIRGENIELIGDEIKIYLLFIIIGLCFETIIIKEKIKNEFDDMSSLSCKKKRFDESLLDNEKRMKEIKKMDNYNTLNEEIEKLNKTIEEMKFLNERENEGKLNENEKEERIQKKEKGSEKENNNDFSPNSDVINITKINSPNSGNKANDLNLDKENKIKIKELETQIARYKSIILESNTLEERKKELGTKINEIKDRIFNLKIPRKKYLGIDYQKNEYYYFISMPNKIYLRNKQKKEWYFYDNKEDIQKLISKLTDKGKNEKKLKQILKYVLIQIKEREENEKEKEKSQENGKEQEKEKEDGLEIDGNIEMKDVIKMEDEQEKKNKVQIKIDKNRNDEKEMNKREISEMLDNICNSNEVLKIKDKSNNENIYMNERKISLSNEGLDKSGQSQTKKDLFTFVINKERLELNIILMKIDDVFSEYLVQFNKQWESDKNRSLWKKIISSNPIDSNILNTLKMFNHKFKNPYKILTEEELNEFYFRDKSKNLCTTKNFIFIDSKGKKLNIPETNTQLILSPKVKIWSREMDLIDMDSYYINNLLVNSTSHEQLCYVVHFYEMAIFGLVHRREGKRKL